MSLKNDFDTKYNIIDESTPRNAFMSGHYKKSFAYYTLRSCLPVVLTNVIDILTKDKNIFAEKFSVNSREELKIIIGLISRLKYELQTDKPFQLFKGDEPDRVAWNNFITHLPENQCTFYKACWLHAECYMYRKLYSFFENSIYFKNFDYFEAAKRRTITDYIEDILNLTMHTRRTDKSPEVFQELLKLDLWSNRNDLSTPYEKEKFDNKTILDELPSFDDNILVNHSQHIWKCLDSSKITPGKTQQVDIICDNAGFELFADFILAEYMIEKGLATKVRFHVKAHPWFVSDLTANDFRWTLSYLSEHTDYIISLIGKKFIQFLDEGKFELAPTSHFWTGPYPFFSMREIVPDLYQTLSQSKLILFKGDLNYRKLLGDVCWDTTQDLRTCLRGFLPTNFCTLRTLRAEIICGLPDGVCNDLDVKDPHWMTSGNYGIMQFVDATHEFGY